jgi:WXG100 family type VII secretion target
MDSIVADRVASAVVNDGGGLPGSGQNISVVPEKVREVGKYAYSLAEALRSALDSAAKDVDSLANGSWTGDAATKFANGWTEVHDGGIQIITALSGMAEKLGVTADTYQARDENSAAALNTSSLDLP